MKQIESVAIGTVSKVDAKLGRIKVMFKWMKPEQESNWAPIASLLAGKQRGARFMPVKDDEVLVAFDRGKFEFPYVVGFLWNDVDKSPDDNEHNRVIVTPGGHQLRFEDKTGAKKVVVKTDGGLSVTMDDSTKSIEIKAGDQTVTLSDALKSIELKGGGRSVSLKAGQLTIT
jgi:uncharacterized protein involved in type VI secretion and phage assembly